MAKMIKIRISSFKNDDEFDRVTGIGLPNETIDERPSIQQSGFHSIPNPGSVGIGIVEGDNINIIATTDTEKPELTAAGDVSVHNGDEKYLKIVGTYLEIKFGNVLIKLDDSDNITLLGSGNRIRITGSGDVELGDVSLKKLITEDILTVLNTHTHSGVTVGAGVTGAPTFVPPLSTTLHATQKTTAK